MDFRKIAIFATIVPLIALATDYEFDCGDCDVYDAIDVNNWISHTGNLDSIQWRRGDVITLTNVAGDAASYLYSPMYGRFVPNPGGGGGSSGSGGGSSGSGGGGGSSPGSGTSPCYGLPDDCGGYSPV